MRLFGRFSGDDPYFLQVHISYNILDSGCHIFYKKLDSGCHISYNIFMSSMMSLRTPKDGMLNHNRSKPWSRILLGSRAQLG